MTFNSRSRQYRPLGLAVLAALLAFAALRSPAGPPATQPVRAGMRRPMPQPVPDEPAVVTDAQVDKAIHRGVDYLLSGVFDPSKPFQASNALSYDPQLLFGRSRSSFECGVFALSVYALLESGLATNDPRLDPRHDLMRTLMAEMKGCESDDHETYLRGIRATALAVYNRPEDRDALMEDAYWLVSVCDGGAYTYKYPTPKMPPHFSEPVYSDEGGSRNPAPPDPAPDTLEDDVARILNRPSAPSFGRETTKPSRPGDRPRPDSRGELARRVALAKTFSDHPVGIWDNSNSQYGLLGVWSAAEAGVEIPPKYWEAVDRHWSECQVAGGPWPYQTGEHVFDNGSPSMTFAGLASLMVTHLYLDPPRVSDDVGRNPYSLPVYGALRWFEHGHNSVEIESQARFGLPGYGLYAVERVGLISGFKHFGSQDWYRDIARKLVTAQRPDGSWQRDAIETSYCLLFLARGRHPVLMSKLQFDGDVPAGGASPVAPVAAHESSNRALGGGRGAPSHWTGYWANRPRDVANLARFAGNRLERRFNWQVVNVALDWTDWTDAPVMELASHTAPELSPRDIDMIRQYILAGGLLFTQADGNSEIFNRYAVKLAHQLFPQYEMVDVPADSPLYTNETVYNVRPRPPLKMVSNGSRILMLHSPTDITRWWQQRDDIRHKDAFQLGMNLFVYAAGKQNFRNRLQETWVTRPTEEPISRVGLARVGYAGNWDPEPFAWRRYANWFQRRTGTRIDTRAVAAADLGALDPIDCPLAHLTGTARENFTRAEIGAVRQYVQSGGVLLIDQCGGMGTFDLSAEKLLAVAFSGQKLQPLPVNHPLLKLGNPGTQDVSRPLVRAEVVARYGRGAGVLRMISYGRGHVLYTPLDITSGLLGTSTLGILGYDPDYAQALVKNIVFWTLDGQKDE